MAFLIGCARQPTEQNKTPPVVRPIETPLIVPRDQITQISVVNALMLGEYDGIATLEELLRYGDFGVGTLDHLDGELIVLDGRAFQVHGDGLIAQVPLDAKIPFAVVTPFDPSGELSFPAILSLATLDERLNESIGHPNKFLAVRVQGEFSSITLRSVKAQTRPYRPLGEVAREQSVWTRQNVRGTLIGIRSPSWVKGLNVPGYHWHFLSEDFLIGGHVLECTASQATVHYDVCHQWLVRLVDSPGFDTADLNQDLNRELQRVESSRGGDPSKSEPEK